MEVYHNQSLKNYNTFGIDVKARTFVSVDSVRSLKKILSKTYASELFILGGGSNILFTRDVEATVVHINLKGKKLISEDEEQVWVEAMAGENWHEFVLWCIKNGYGGVENLSLIPGNVGTAPMQNIGAYGVELKNVFVECKALDIQTLQPKVFSKEACKFGYRESVFKKELKGRYVIVSVVFKLTRKNHDLHLKYGSIKEELTKMGIDTPGIEDISRAVMKIRQSKLPNPKEIGNSGSFFKNPIITKSAYEDLKGKFPDVPSYEVSDKLVKIPAGWLIDHAGFKGYREGDAGVHKNQALVLVNYGNATGTEILGLALKIQEKIKKDYGIKLEPEVNVY